MLLKMPAGGGPADRDRPGSGFLPRAAIREPGMLAGKKPGARAGPQWGPVHEPIALFLVVKSRGEFFFVLITVVLGHYAGSPEGSTMGSIPQSAGGSVRTKGGLPAGRRGRVAEEQTPVENPIFLWEDLSSSCSLGRVPVPIFPHASLDSLIHSLAGRWSARREGPLPVPVVVPSIPFSDYLQLRIAQECGVCMGFDFLTPQAFISRALGQGESLWSKRHLCWRILPHVRAYAAELGIPDPAPRDRFAIAELLAERFDQYGHFRPEIILRWASGQSALKSGAPAREQANEAWQRQLWSALSREIPAPHPAIEIGRLRNDTKFQTTLRAAFPHLLVLGTGAIDPLLIHVLGLLSDAGGDVSIHVVLPSLEYLGDLRRRNALPPEDSDPESIEAGGGHPLFESMGRHAIGSFLLLGKLDDQYTHWPEPGRTESQAQGLLQRLQSDIRALRKPEIVEKAEDDISLRVHSCFGPRREIEVLRSEILRAFQDIPDLKPEDIHILTPSLETYAPLVSAVLEQGGTRLPVRLTELPPSVTDPVIEGVLALLEMARSGRFEASWILELLNLRAVQESLGVAEDEKAIESVRGWVRQSGLTQGLGDEEPGSWGFARDRLIAGRWLGAEGAARYPDGKFILPVADQLDGAPDLLGRFIAWHSRLEATFREWRLEATPPQWGDRLERAGADLLSGQDESRLAIQPHLAFLRTLECGEPTDTGAILDWLASESGAAGIRGKVSGRITFGRFKQLQNIPCRVLMMVGMQEGPFPGQGRVPGWDLLQADPRVWDRNARVDDRQLFLDAVLTPTDRLVITAANRNLRSGKDEPLSPCVDELLRVAGAMGVPKSALVIKHRLQPFAPEYFDGSKILPPSFDPAHAKAAAALAAADRLPGIPFWTGRGSDAEEEGGGPIREIPVHHLVEFWRDPAKAFLKAQGLAIPQEDEDEEALDRAPLTLDGLQAWKIKSAVVEGIVHNPDTLELAEARLRADRGLPPGNLGSRGWQANRELSEPLGHGVKTHLGGEVSVELELPGIRLTGTLLTAGEGDRILVYRVGKFSHAKDFFDPWIRALVASAAGLKNALWLLDESNPGQAREYPAIDPQEAGTVLAALVRGFLEGQQSPLAYGPATSEACAKSFAATGDRDAAVDAAAAAWTKEAFQQLPAGEGHSPAARIAWRDLNAFDDPGPWTGWAEAVALPLRKWMENSPTTHGNEI